MSNVTPVATIDREIALAAPPDRVWRALTSDVELATWFCQAASFPTLPGADGWLEWTEHGRFAVRCVTFDPPSRLAYRWARDPGTPVDAGPATRVELTLTPVGDGTRLRVREHGFVRDEDRAINITGWEGTEQALRGHLARGLGIGLEVR